MRPLEQPLSQQELSCDEWLNRIVTFLRLYGPKEYKELPEKQQLLAILDAVKKDELIIVYARDYTILGVFSGHLEDNGNTLFCDFWTLKDRSVMPKLLRMLFKKYPNRVSRVKGKRHGKDLNYDTRRILSLLLASCKKYCS